MAVVRETLVMKSVEDYLQDVLFNQKGYPRDRIEWLEEFPYERWKDGDVLERNYVTVGFNFDDGGKALELGSALIQRIYTIEFFVFGVNALWGSNLANAVRDAAVVDDRIPLKDVSQAAAPVIDYLLVNRSSAERQIIPNAQPFQQFVWTAHLVIQDEYDARLV